MKDSIRLRLYLGIVILAVSFILISWMVNSLFGEAYYFAKKKQQLMSFSLEVEDIYNEYNLEDLLAYERLERGEGLYISIFNAEKTLVYDSFRSKTGRGHHPAPPKPPAPSGPPVPPAEYLFFRLEKLENASFLIFKVKDDRLNTISLDLVKKMNNGCYLLLRVPVAPIKANAGIANTLLIFSGILSILAGGIVAFLFSGLFTRPIVELKNIAERMAGLDFSSRYTEKRNDEIGQLGKSINSLSSQLHRSISELQEANDKLKEDIEKERQIDVMRKEFVSSVSHELKTPVSLIQGYAEGLKCNVIDIDDEKSKLEYCDVIIDEAKRMDKLIEGLLDLSQLEAGNFSLFCKSFNIADLIESVSDKFKTLMRPQNIQFQVDMDYKGIVFADPVRIEQVLVNYLNNAIAHVDGKRNIRIYLENCQHKVCISVYNTGKPIPEESMDKIWMSFYKLDKSRTRESGGTGLGLSIVRSIMNLHKTGFGVENIDDGVRFWFMLWKEDRVHWEK